MSVPLSEQKVAIVTGASAGIGRATAVALSDNNWKLVITARRAKELEETAKLCPGYIPAVVAGDIADEETVVRVFETAKIAYGRIDLVFNNAGANAPGTAMEDLALSKFQDVMNTNVSGTFLCTREAFKYFKDQDPQGGRIINNASISAHTPRPHSIAYTASKHAIAGITKCANLDGRGFNISCTQLDIGNARTDMAARLESGVMQANGEIKAEPMMDVEYVANSIVHIANLPTSVTVDEFRILATGMPFAGRG